MDEKLKFDFDASGILPALEKVIARFDSWIAKIDQVGTKSKESESKTSKAAGDAGKAASGSGFLANASLTKLLGTFGLLQAAWGGLKSAFSNLPEVGRTFEFVGRVFFTNFLQPLRAELIPLLNKLTAWVSDNRGTFVKWGATLASIFRIVVGFAQMLWKALGVVVENIKASLASAFGAFTGSIQDVIDTIITKIAATIIFIMVLLEPVFALVGRIIGFLAAGMRGFFEGFMEGAGGVIESVTAIIDAVVKIFDALMRGMGGAKGFAEVMRRVGKIVGAVWSGILQTIAFIMPVLEPIAEFIGAVLVMAINQMLDSLEAIPSIVRTIWSAFKSVGAAVVSAFDGVADFFKTYLIDPIATAFKWIGDTARKFFTWIEQKFTALTGWVGDAWKSVKGLFGGDDEEAPKRGGGFGGGGANGGFGGALPLAGNTTSRTTSNTSVSAPLNVTVNGGNPAEVQEAVRRGQAQGIDDALRRSINRSAEANGI